MKLRLLLPVVALVTFFMSAVSYHALSQDNTTGKKILYYTCSMHPSVKSDKPGNCPYCGMGLEAVYADDDATNSPSSSTNAASADNTKPTPYPLTTCVVSGEKFGGDMGDPIVFVYSNGSVNQEIKFCCPSCKPKFLKDPDKYMKIILDAEAKK